MRGYACAHCIYSFPAIHTAVVAREVCCTGGMCLFNLGITLFTALVCGFLFYKLKVPGGMMVGAIIGVSALSITTASAFMPAEAKLTAQCLAGAFIACSVEKSDLQNLKKIWKPALFLLGAMLGLNLIAGLLIYWVQLLGYGDVAYERRTGRHERHPHHRCRYGGRMHQRWRCCSLSVCRRA